MTKKSAARAKVVKPEPEEMSIADKQEKLHKLFDENKWAFVETVKTQVRTADRFDNFANLRDLALRILEKEDVTVSLVNALVEESINSYSLVQERAEKFEFEKFIEDEPFDYFEDIMPDRTKIVDDLDILYAVIRFMSVKPYGDKMLQMWQTIQMAKKELNL